MIVQIFKENVPEQYLSSMLVEKGGQFLCRAVLVLGIIIVTNTLLTRDIMLHRELLKNQYNYATFQIGLDVKQRLQASSGRRLELHNYVCTINTPLSHLGYILPGWRSI